MATLIPLFSTINQHYLRRLQRKHMSKNTACCNKQLICLICRRAMYTINLVNADKGKRSPVRKQSPGLPANQTTE